MRTFFLMMCGVVAFYLGTHGQSIVIDLGITLVYAAIAEILQIMFLQKEYRRDPI